MSHLFKKKYLFISLVLFLILASVVIHIRSSIISSTFRAQFENELNDSLDLVKSVSYNKDIVNIFNNFSSKKEFRQGYEVISNVFSSVYAVEMVALFNKKNNVYRYPVFFSKNSSLSTNVLLYSFTNKIPIFRYHEKLYYVVNMPVLGVFNNEKGRVSAVINIDNFFKIINFKRIKVRGITKNEFKSFSGISFFSKNHKINISLDDVIHSFKCEVNGQFIVLSSYFSLGYVFLLMLSFHILVVILLRIESKFQIVTSFAHKIFKKQKSDTHRILEEMNEDIYPVVHILKSEILDLKQTLKQNSKKKKKPDDHIDVIDIKSDEECDVKDVKAAKEVLEEMLNKAGKKTALVDDPSIPKQYVYAFETEQSIVSYNEDSFIPPVEDPSKKQKFTAGKTRMMESDEEKKIVFNKKLSKNFDNINLSDVG